MRPPAGPSLAHRAPTATAEEQLVKPEDLTDWDWAVFLLHTAAEVEHSLMTQYLYAAYSLGPPFTGSDVPADAATRVARWQRTLLAIAREEMAHFATVQNLLYLIGGALNLEREDFPFRSELYPFPFRLEPVTKASLARYVAAEMPADPPDPADEVMVDEVRTRAGASRLGVNRVGIVYSTLVELLKDPQRIADTDFREATAETLQARKEDWFGSRDLLVRQVASRQDAVTVLDLIARQGEGSDEPSAGTGPSHYARLRDIYREFPEPPVPGDVAAWSPTKPVPDNPNTQPEPSLDPDVEASRITHPDAILWARLFNVRYRLLLLDLSHAFKRKGPMGEAPDVTPRGHLRDAAFFEMRGRPPLRRAGLRSLALKLTTLPLKDAAPAGADARVAGPPFELPYSLAIPGQERDRWRLHQALLESSEHLVNRIRATADDPILQELTEADAIKKDLVASQLAEAPE